MHHTARSLSLMVLLMVGGACGGKDGWVPLQASQRRAARQYWPAELELPGAPHAHAQRLRVRVHVDQQWRAAGGAKWEARAQGLIARANDYLAPAFGVELEADLVPWQRQAAGDALEPILDELEALDDGDGAEWVLGLTGASPTFTTAHHHLGVARPLGKHMVVRAMNDAEEARDIDQAFDKLSAQERLRLYAARKAHKELVVLLHEWAHTVGAMHERGEGMIMAAGYRVEASTMSEAQARLVELALAWRLAGDETARGKARAALVAHLRGLDDEAWEPGEAETLLALLGEAPSGGGDGAPRFASKAEASRYNQALAEAKAGRVAEAWAQIAPLVAAHESMAPVQELGCWCAAEGLPEPAARAACRRLVALRPADPEARGLAVRAAVVAGDDAAALAELAEAEAAFAAARAQPGAWRQVAELALAIGALSAADALLAHAGNESPTQALRARALALRRLLGLPADGKRVGIAAAAEPDYFRSFMRVYEPFMDGEPEAQEIPIGVALERYPKAPGLLALACGVQLYRERPKQAKPLCAKALSGWDETVLAHFFAAQLVKGKTRIAHLEQVISLDPQQKGAWRLLHAAYTEAGRADDAARLERDYKQRFSEPLAR